MSVHAVWCVMWWCWKEHQVNVFCEFLICISTHEASLYAVYVCMYMCVRLCLHMCACVCVSRFYMYSTTKKFIIFLVTHSKCIITRRHLTSKVKWGKSALSPRTYFLVESVLKTATSNKWQSGLRHSRSVHHTDELNSERGDPRVTTSLKLRGAAAVTEGSWLDSADQRTRTLQKNPKKTTYLTADIWNKLIHVDIDRRKAPMQKMAT